MSARADGQGAPRREGRGAGPIMRRAALVWLALVALLAATVAGAYLPIGGWKPVLALGIALAKAGLVAAIFMELSSAGAVVRLAAAAGALFAAVLFALTFADEATRQHAPGIFPGGLIETTAGTRLGTALGGPAIPAP